MNYKEERDKEIEKLRANPSSGQLWKYPIVQCTGCEVEAEQLTREHPEFKEFCEMSGVNSNDMEQVFRRVCECTEDLEVKWISGF